MLKKFLLITIASLVVLPAMAAKPTGKPDKGSKGGGAVPLDVVFNNASSYKFRDDHDGPDNESLPYLNGIEGVEAEIDKFRFKLNVGLNGSRNFRLDLSDCISPSPECESPTLYSKGWNVFATSPDGAQYLTMLNGASQPVNFQLVFFDAPPGDNQWSLKFNPNECPEGGSLASMATVTRTSEDTWTFTAGASNVACLYFQEGPRKKHTFNGLYSVPFKITARSQ